MWLLSGHATHLAHTPNKESEPFCFLLRCGIAVPAAECWMTFKSIPLLLIPTSISSTLRKKRRCRENFSFLSIRAESILQLQEWWIASLYVSLHRIKSELQSKPSLIPDPHDLPTNWTHNSKGIGIYTALPGIFFLLSLLFSILYIMSVLSHRRSRPRRLPNEFYGALNTFGMNGGREIVIQETGISLLEGERRQAGWEGAKWPRSAAEHVLIW